MHAASSIRGRRGAGDRAPVGQVAKQAPQAVQAVEMTTVTVVDARPGVAAGVTMRRRHPPGGGGADDDEGQHVDRLGIELGQGGAHDGFGRVGRCR